MNGKKIDLIYPELSYKIVEVLFEVYNEIGPGHHEKYYQRAVSVGLKKESLNFNEQVYTPIVFNNTKIGSYFLDFLIDNKVILEIKKGDRFSKNNIDQINSYLEAII